MEPDIRTREELIRENRTLRWKNSQIGKGWGRASATIFALRGEVALLREALKFTPGDYTRLLAQKQELAVEVAQLRTQLAELNKKPTNGNPLAGLGGGFGQAARGVLGGALQRELNQGVLADRAELSDQVRR